MKEIEGIKLVGESLADSNRFYLLIWLEDEPSQQIPMKNESECDKIMKQIIKGEGVELSYDFQKRIVRVFPRRVLKIEVSNDFGLSDKDLDTLRDNETFTPETKFPGDFENIGNNIYNPSLVRT